MTAARARLAAGALAWAAAAGATITVAPTGGVFQYYVPYAGVDYVPYYPAQARVGGVVTCAARVAGETRAFEGEFRWRGYEAGTDELAAEGRLAFFFHAAPARPYVAPTAGYTGVQLEHISYDLATAGARAGALLGAAPSRWRCDVYGGYRAQVLVGGRSEPRFFSECYAGGEATWAVTSWLGFRAAGEVLWPGFLAAEHFGPGGPTVAPLVLLGPTLTL